MKTLSLHHPDVSLTVMGRRTAGFFLDCVATYAEFLVSRGRCGLVRGCFPSDGAYRAAVQRLRSAGVVVYRKRHDGSRVIALSGHGYAVPDELNPERLWNKRWDGLWRVLVYDIEESERGFRNGLRNYLQRLRMGYLQQSVWVSPRDIRPAYADLQAALNVESVSYLFECRTVLSRKSHDVVDEAWDVDRLREDQEAYIHTWSDGVGKLRQSLSTEEIGSLMREELLHFTEVMRRDPLLPRDLLPSGYRGMKAYGVHQAFVKALRRLVE